MASFVTNKGASLLSKSYWEGAADIEVMLLKTSYVPNKDHDFVDDIVASEIVATNYARTNLATRTATIDNANDRVDIDAADTAFGALGGATNDTIRYAAIIENVGGSDATRPVLIITQMTLDTPTNGSTITVQWAAVIARLST